MSSKKPDWTKDPDRILEVALMHTLWDPAFKGRLLERVAGWLDDKPRERDHLRERLKNAKPSRQPLPTVEYAALLARYNMLRRSGEYKTSAEVNEYLANLESKDVKTIEGQLTTARKMLKNGEFGEWPGVFD